LPNHHETLIVGGGISGVGAAIRLTQEGLTDFAILEAADDFGGTWRANTYPGCACDVPSRLYSYSFAPNLHWTRAFAGQPEILDYVRYTARAHGLYDRVHFGVRMEDAHWDRAQRLWRLTTTSGEITCRFLVAGAGPWNEPLIPDLPGIESFPGEVFHSARWRHDVDLAGRRVAVLGSGASAVQFVPAIQPEVGALHLFQRTAQWVLPKPDHTLSRAERFAIARVPGARRAFRQLEYSGLELVGLAIRNPRLITTLQAVGRAYLRTTVKDRGLRAKLTPAYTLGCKRLLFSNNYLQALTQENVAVHAAAVSAIEGPTVVGSDGSRTEVDTIILGTGFHILDMPLADHVHDAHGRSLSDHWAGSPEAYLGTMTTGFPNAFLLLGPSLGTGHTSAFTILEAQLELVLSAIKATRPVAGAVLEVRPEAQAAYVAQVQSALGSTVYNAGGCRSYYFDVNGRNSFSWPWSTARLRRTVGRFVPDDVTITTPTHQPTSEVTA
jgi:cyclohexanone monooxygenase